MDALTLLRNDHQTVEKLFKEFESLGERAYKTKKKVADQIVRELSIHATIEEQLFYPAIRERVEQSEDEVLEALEEHHMAKLALNEIEKLEPEHERFTAKVTVLIESVRHHKKEEEQQLFPKVRKAFTSQELQELGEQLEAAKAAAPTRPHPMAPDEPPANVVTGAASAVMDAGLDVAKGMKNRLRPGR